MDLLAEDTYLFYCDAQTCRIQNQQIFSLLNIADCERYVRINTPLRKYQFGLARCIVKQVLFEHFDIPLTHSYTINNYCEWVVTDTNDKFYISISHSKNLVVVALSVTKQRLGVDVEFQKDRNFLELINHFTSENEKALFQQSSDKKQSFYQLWTAKEAYIKAFQMALSELSRIDLAPCLSAIDTQQGYYLYQQLLEKEGYSVSLISEVATSTPIQQLFME